MSAFKVGETWNLAPDSQGLKVHLEPAGDHANLTIIVSLSKPAASEIKALTKRLFQFYIWVILGLELLIHNRK